MLRPSSRLDGLSTCKPTSQSSNHDRDCAHGVRLAFPNDVPLRDNTPSEMGIVPRAAGWCSADGSADGYAGWCGR